jgi:hypothetical protein
MMRFSKIIVAAIVVANIIFTAAVLYIFLRTGSEPSVLIGAWFAFTTGELWALAGIKKSEQKKDDSACEKNSPTENNTTDL